MRTPCTAPVHACSPTHAHARPRTPTHAHATPDALAALGACDLNCALSYLVGAWACWRAAAAVSVYSIRLKLLAPDEEGGLSAAERGFETAQLSTRHWRLVQASGEVESVDGPGVVGRFPLLREGGWREDRQRDASGRLSRGPQCSGLFVYQSQSGRGETVAFEGEIVMVPGSLAQPTGDEFRIQVARFPIGCTTEEFIL